MKNQTKLTLVLVAFILTFSTNAQNFEKSKDPFTAIDGKTYYIGDTVILCTAADYGNTFHHFYMGKNLTPIRAYYTAETFNKGDEIDYRFSAHIIKQFRNYDDGRTIALTNKMFGYGVDINGALQTGEVACQDYLDYWADTTRFFLKKKAFLGALKTMDAIDKNTTKEYAYRFDRKAYKANFQDEFSFHSFLSKKKEELEKELSEFDEEKLYVLPVKLEFGSYDFDNNSFPIVWNGNMMPLLRDQTENLIVRDVNSEGIDLMDLNVFLENKDDFSSFKLHPTKAKILIDYRKSATGSIDRTLYAGVWIKIKRMAGDKFHADYDITDKSKSFLICEVKRMDLFEDDTYLYHYLSTVKK